MPPVQRLCLLSGARHRCPDCGDSPSPTIRAAPVAAAIHPATAKLTALTIAAATFTIFPARVTSARVTSTTINSATGIASCYSPTSSSSTTFVAPAALAWLPDATRSTARAAANSAAYAPTT
jgi:hypothetical protein